MQEVTTVLTVMAVLTAMEANELKETLLLELTVVKKVCVELGLKSGVGSDV